MNISEANDTNILLSWVIGRREKFGDRTDAEASEMTQKAAERLADRATARIMAGLSGEQVAAAWPMVEVGPWRDGDR